MLQDLPPVDDPSDLNPEAVVDLFLDARQLEYTEETLRDYESRLGQFVAWTDDQDDIETMADLSGWHLEQFRVYRQGQGLAATTMKGQMQCLKKWLEYAADIGAVDEMFPHRVRVPKLDQDEETSDTLLEADAAHAAIEWFRDSRTEYASEEHVALEIAWFVGARLGGIRALDCEDFHREESYLTIRNRAPETRLKKGPAGERAVRIPDETAAVLGVYVDEVRHRIRDDQGRDPLLTSSRGRPSLGTIQNWIYHATIPCRHSDCPHDKSPRTCEWTGRNDASGCPSSRAPHHVRTGSITWQLNQGLTYEAVAERVNSDPDTLRRYYDKASDVERMELRRSGLVDDLEFNSDQ